jgi:hypothetical protein
MRQEEPGMALVIGLIAALVLLSAGAVFMWTRLGRANARRIEPQEGELKDLFWGDVMCRGVITSGSLARLEIFDWGVRLRGVVISRWIVPTWEARYDELGTAGLARLPHSRVAVWLRVADDAPAIGFLCDRFTQILPVLERHGVQVDRSITKVRKVDELYK